MRSEHLSSVAVDGKLSTFSMIIISLKMLHSHSSQLLDALNGFFFTLNFLRPQAAASLEKYELIGPWYESWQIVSREWAFFVKKQVASQEGSLILSCCMSRKVGDNYTWPLLSFVVDFCLSFEHSRAVVLSSSETINVAVAS